MDLYGSQMIETSRQSNSYYDFLKKALQFLVPLSLMSFLLSYSYHFSTLVIPLFSHALERKYMFLICNGILAFLAKTLNFTSSFTITTDLENTCPPFYVQSSDTLDLDGEFGKGIGDVASKNDVKTKDAEFQHEEEKQENTFFNVEVEAESQGGALKVLETEEEGGTLKVLETQEGEREERGGRVDASQPDEEENDDTNISTEELNRKVGEFIGKMKEEIRIETKQQLIAV